MPSLQPCPLPPQSPAHVHPDLCRAQDERVLQTAHPVLVVHLLVILAGQHVREMGNARIVRQRDLVPARAPAAHAIAVTARRRDHAAHDLRQPAALRAHHARELPPVLEVLVLLARLECQEVEHRHRASPLSRPELVDPLPERGVEFQGLRRRCHAGPLEAARQRRHVALLRVQQPLVLALEVGQQAGGHAGFDTPLVRDVLLHRGWERGRRGQAEEDVPVDVLCEEGIGRYVRGQDDPADDAGDG